MDLKNHKWAVVTHTYKLKKLAHFEKLNGASKKKYIRILLSLLSNCVEHTEPEIKMGCLATSPVASHACRLQEHGRTGDG